MSLITKRNFANALCKLYDEFENIDFDIQGYSEEVIDAFKEIGKGALNQDKYASMLEFGKEVGNDPEEEEYGIRIKGTDIFVPYVLNRLERIPIPETILDRFPDMSQDEWKATIRFASLMALAFTPSKKIAK